MEDGDGWCSGAVSKENRYLRLDCRLQGVSKAFKEIRQGQIWTGVERVCIQLFDMEFQMMEKCKQ